MKFRNFFARLVIFSVVWFVLNILTASALSESKRDWIKADRYYPRLKLREFYQLPSKSIRLLVTGSSRSFYGIDPQLITKASGIESFNLGSPHQPLSATYYLLREAFIYQDIQYVVLELHYEMLTRSYTRPYKLYIFENMKNSWNKLEYFLQGFNFKEKVYYLFPMLDRRNNLKYIYDKLRGNSHADFSEDEQYLGRGFVSSGEKLNEDNCDKVKYEWKDSAITADAREYYHKIAQFVKSHDAQLVVVNFPYPDVVEIVNMEQFSASYQRFVQQDEGIIMIDYQNNRLRFPVDEYFDVHHLNKWGAGRLSEDLGNKIARMAEQY